MPAPLHKPAESFSRRLNRQSAKHSLRRFQRAVFLHLVRRGAASADRKILALCATALDPMPDLGLGRSHQRTFEYPIEIVSQDIPENKMVMGLRPYFHEL